MFPRFSVARNTIEITDRRIVPELNERRSPLGLRRIYLLVHGFNNDRNQARFRYNAFRRRMENLLGRDLEKVWELYWPGYDDLIAEPLRLRWKPLLVTSSVVTAARYYKQVPKACQAGALLGGYINRLSALASSTEVVLLGHSLGCRVILEAMKHLAGTPTSHHSVPAICLMAAAVPIGFLDDPQELKAAVKFPERSIALYSRRDTVLRHTFPVGQSLAREGTLPEAVGLRGNPLQCWTARDETMLRHGEYWTSSVTNAHVARLFGRTTVHLLPRFPPVPRELAEGAQITEYALPIRQIGM